MAKLYDLARMTTATTGTGPITLGIPVLGYISFANAGVQDGDIISYSIFDGPDGECGRGVYTASGTTLTRGPLFSTNANAAISLSGNAQVFIAALAEDVGPPTGSGVPFFGATAPNGYLICDGSAVSRASYAALFAVIGVTYGAGNGSTTFNLPDLRGRTISGFDAGNATSRLTGSPAAGVSANALGNVGGEQGHTLVSPGEIPGHLHPIQDPNHAHAVSDPTHAHVQNSNTLYNIGANNNLSYTGSDSIANAGASTFSAFTGIGIIAAATGITGTDSTGSGGAHNNVQPTLIANWIIKT